jgi:hypothetical protein
MYDVDTTTLSVEERVAAGVEWLREHGAESGLDVERVNLDTLDVADVSACVLAQSLIPGHDDPWYSAYGTALVRATGLDRFDEDAIEWAYEHGFANRGQYDQDALNDQWRRV